MSTLASSAPDASITAGRRSPYAFKLRFDRAAGWIALISAAVWGGIALLIVNARDLSIDPDLLPIENVLRTVANADWLPLALAICGVFALLDAGIGVLLIRQHSLARRVAIGRALIGLVLYGVYFVAAQDFAGAFGLAVLHGLIVTLLTRRAAYIMLYPTLLWLIVFFLLPLAGVLVFSLGRGTTRGTVDMSVLSLDNYAKVFAPIGVSGPIYLNIIWRTVWLSILNTVICLLIGYPFAFWMAQQPQRMRNALLLLVMIPFWTNILIRTYAWLIILRKDGLINDLLINVFQVVDKPLEMVNTPGALLLGLVYGYLPFMILPLYTSIERLDKTLVEAAQDLYAGTRQTFLRVILPLTMPGIIAGSILVFIPSVGTYVVTNVLGGNKTYLLGNVLEQQFIGTTGDKAFGAAIGFILTVFMLIATLVYFRTGQTNSTRS